MMKFQTIFKSLAIILVWMVVGVACEVCDGNANYAITSYDALALEGGADPNTGQIVISPNLSAELEGSDTVYWRYVGFQLTPEVLISSSKQEHSIFNNAMADCEPKGSNPTQKYTGINITSSSAYISTSKT
jgi:hypothetical protein